MADELLQAVNQKLTNLNDSVQVILKDTAILRDTMFHVRVLFGAHQGININFKERMGSLYG